MPLCPECKYEYVAGMTECPDCDVALVEKLEDPAVDPENIIPTANEADASCLDTLDEIEADAACQLLKGSGFPCTVLYQNSPRMPTIVFGMVRAGRQAYQVLVPESRVDEARAILEEVMPKLSLTPEEQDAVGNLTDEV
jgi:hypothetical protein